MQAHKGTARTFAALLFMLAFCAQGATAAIITVNSLADDLFPDGIGSLTDANGAPVALAPHCTLRMALAAANLDVPIGGANGCAAGSAIGADTIGFAGVTLPGTIVLADKPMSTAPVIFPGPVNVPPLFAGRAVTINGPGSSQLTIDGSLAAASGRRIVGASDGNGLALFTFALNGVRLVRGAVQNNTGGCLIASESVSLNDVVFENCEAASGATDGGYGGALFVGVDSADPNNLRPDVTIVNSRFSGNRAARGSASVRSEGGAIALGGTPATINQNGPSMMVGAVQITGTVVNGNTADTRGGMIVGDATSVTITGSHFSANASTGSAAGGTSGRHGGFLLAQISGNVVVNGGTRIVGNVANEERAGFGINGVFGSITLDQVDVTGNFANRGPIGGFDIIADNSCSGSSTVPVTITNSRVVGNSAASQVGGARLICNGALTITDSTFAGNEARGYRLSPADTTANTGTAALVLDTMPSVTLTRVTFLRNNTSATGSGPIEASALGAFTADSIRVLEHSMGSGPALYLNAGGAGRNFLVVNSEISGNSAQNAPALFIEGDGHYTLRNSTVSGNVARNFAGIVRAFVNSATPGGIAIDIEHSTIARNTAPAEEAFSAFASAGGGGNATITVRNSILGGRAPGATGTNAVFFDTANGVTNVTATNSIVENSAGLPAGFCAGTGMKCDIGALVSPLADNGGTTGVKTMALLSGSPAINAGGAVLGGLTTDARGTGFPRVIGGTVDIGALEADPATTTGCTLDVDGNGARDALTDGLLIVRALIGMTGTAATTGTLGAVPLRGDWTSIRNYLNTNCGTSLAP